MYNVLTKLTFSIVCKKSNNNKRTSIACPKSHQLKENRPHLLLVGFEAFGLHCHTLFLLLCVVEALLPAHSVQVVAAPHSGKDSEDEDDSTLQLHPFTLELFRASRRYPPILPYCFDHFVLSLLRITLLRASERSERASSY